MNELYRVLLLALALFAALAWAARRGVLRAKEVVWVGAAMIFFITAVVFRAVLDLTLPVFGGNTPRLLGLTAAMVLPLVLAMAYGVRVLYRRAAGREREEDKSQP